MRSLLRVSIAAILAIIATLVSAEALAAAGFERNSMVNTALCCLWLIAVYTALQHHARREH